MKVYGKRREDCYDQLLPLHAAALCCGLPLGCESMH